MIYLKLNIRIIIRKLKASFIFAYPDADNIFKVGLICIYIHLKRLERITQNFTFENDEPVSNNNGYFFCSSIILIQLKQL